MATACLVINDITVIIRTLILRTQFATRSANLASIIKYLKRYEMLKKILVIKTLMSLRAVIDPYVHQNYSNLKAISGMSKSH